MTFMKLIERQITESGLNYSNTEAVYLEKPFSGESEVRFGQPQFENGGLLDDKEFFATNARLIDELWAYCGEEDPPADACVSELVEYLLELLGEEKE